MIRMEDSGWAKRRLFHFFLDLAKRVRPKILDRERVSSADHLLYRLGDVLVYGPLKNTLGFSHIRVAYTAGEAIGPDLFSFYRSLGINLKQLYGITESSVFLCIQRDGAVRPDTVGAPIEGVEIRIAEVLFRSPGAFQCYYKNPEATADAKRPDGWVHTGDSGFFEADGQLKILDRARDVGRLADGSLIAEIHREQAQILSLHQGSGGVRRWPGIRRRLCQYRPRSGRRLGGAAQPRLWIVPGARRRAGGLRSGRGLHRKGDLAAEPKLAPSQIRRFLILHKELDADDGELTRTRKVRRRIVAARYQSLVDALYASRHTGRIETEITFEDGRRSQMRAELAIRDVATTLPPAEPFPLKKAS